MSTNTWEWEVPPVTHPGSLLRVIGDIFPQNLDRNRQSTVFALPYIRKPTATVRDACRIVARLDL